MSILIYENKHFDIFFRINLAKKCYGVKKYQINIRMVSSNIAQVLSRNSCHKLLTQLINVNIGQCSVYND